VGLSSKRAPSWAAVNRAVTPGTSAVRAITSARGVASFPRDARASVERGLNRCVNGVDVLIAQMRCRGGDDGAKLRCLDCVSTRRRWRWSEVVPVFVELEVAVPRLMPASR
jgi:hypothetical protein